MKILKKWMGAVVTAVLTVCVVIAMQGVGVTAVAASVVNPQRYTPDLATSPTVVATVHNADQLNDFTEGTRPTNAILTVDGTLTVLALGGGSLGTLSTVHAILTENKIIPIVAVDSTLEADALIAYIQSGSLIDIVVMSADAALVKRVRTECASIRGIVDYSGSDISAREGTAILGESNASYANVIVLSKEQADRKTVTFFQSRLKTVWVNAGRVDEFDCFSVVSSGAFGIIAENYGDVYTAYDKYESGSLSREFYNIAHRGACVSSTENTLEGCKLAMDNGATHIEVDVQVTQDNKLVIMHDSTIDRTTNGSGTVSAMTLAALRGYKVIKNTNGLTMGIESVIPTLDEIFELFADTYADKVLVLEIKTGAENVVSLIKERVDAHDMYGKMVVIAFSDAQLARMRDTLPQIPTASLNAIYQNTIADDLEKLSRLNTALNAASDYSYFQNRNLKARGYQNWVWTYSTTATTITDIKLGVVGLTNNVADQFGYLPRRIYAAGGLTVDEAFAGKSFDLTLECYDGTTDAVSCPIFSYSQNGNTIRAIFRYATDYGYTLYSEPVTLTIPVFDPDDQNPGGTGNNGDNNDTGESGCKSSARSGIALTFLPLAAATLLLRLKKTKKS